jgi:hypothetical protein
MIHALKQSDQVARTNFAVDMLERIDASPDFLHQVCFLDEATFHVNGIVNRYNCRIWGSQNPCVTCELERGSPKVNVWAGLMHVKLIGPFFFFLEKTVTKRSYLDMLELCPSYHIKLSSNNMGRRHISATMLGITWTERRLGDGLADVEQ